MKNPLRKTHSFSSYKKHNVVPKFNARNFATGLKSLNYRNLNNIPTLPKTVALPKHQHILRVSTPFFNRAAVPSYKLHALSLPRLPIATSFRVSSTFQTKPPVKIIIPSRDTIDKVTILQRKINDFNANHTMLRDPVYLGEWQAIHAIIRELKPLEGTELEPGIVDKFKQSFSNEETRFRAEVVHCKSVSSLPPAQMVSTEEELQDQNNKNSHAQAQASVYSQYFPSITSRNTSSEVSSNRKFSTIAKLVPIKSLHEKVKDAEFNYYTLLIEASNARVNYMHDSSATNHAKFLVAEDNAKLARFEWEGLKQQQQKVSSSKKKLSTSGTRRVTNIKASLNQQKTSNQLVDVFGQSTLYPNKSSFSTSTITSVSSPETLHTQKQELESKISKLNALIYSYRNSDEHLQLSHAMENQKRLVGEHKLITGLYQQEVLSRIEQTEQNLKSLREGHQVPADSREVKILEAQLVGLKKIERSLQNSNVN